MGDYGQPSLRVRRGRGGRPWRAIQARVYSEETHCWLCGRYVDQTLDSRQPMSRTVDHLDELRLGGAPLDRDRCRLAHRRCNSIRSNKARGRAAPRQMIMVDPHSL